MAMSLSPALSLSSPCASSLTSSPLSVASHSRSNSESLLFTPPLSPTEEQLLAFLIPDIEPSELAAYLSAPTTPVLSDVSCLIGKSIAVADERHASSTSALSNAEAVYPSPVCAAAAATVVALDRLDTEIYTALSSLPSTPRDAMMDGTKKRCSTYAFMDLEDDDEERQEQPAFATSGPVYVMSSRNTRKRLMLEQAFVSPDEEEDCNATQSCYAQLFQGSEDIDLTSDLSSTLAFDLVLV
ncbi:hypothetical protein BGZ99_005445 [Dissophora globulifera]|uniref:Uncharacterized protein n=1 Tax=Dissophora globulifera TaxID=979702 RepID=A0A9P6RH08_9FUNG|nr:hypothetical protein BGZ99_005445 [Dissophora globulifera]